MRRLWRLLQRWRARRAEAARWERAEAARGLLAGIREANRAADLASLAIDFRHGGSGAAHPPHNKGLSCGCCAGNRRATHALLDVVVPDHMAAPSPCRLVFMGLMGPMGHMGLINKDK